MKPRGDLVQRRLAESAPELGCRAVETGDEVQVISASGRKGSTEYLLDEVRERQKRTKSVIY